MARYPPHPKFTEKLHKLVNEREKYMKNSEKKCSKRRMGGVELSPEVIVWKKRRDVWNLLIRLHKGVLINRVIIKRRSKVCGIQRPLSFTLTEAERANKIFRDEFERLKPDADVYRASLLVHIVKEEVSRGNIKKAK